MACAIARPTFSFHLQTSQPQPKPRLNLTISLLHPKTPITSPQRLQTSSKSIDVSKEEIPISEDPDSIQPIDSPEEVFDKRRFEERFVVLNTGVYECRSCGYNYDQAVGDPSYPIPPGLQFEKLPEDWRCATCGAAKSFFQSKSVEIAGFAENQQFGLGANTLTSGQKLILIYGSLLAFFVLFLSGYFLQ